MSFRRIDIGMVPAWVGRMTYTGDLGYEIWVAPEYQRALFDLLWEAGQPYGMALFGFRALMALRMEKMLRHLVPRVPADLHAARGRHGPLPEARPRLHRARSAGGRDGAGDRSGRLVYLDVDPDPDEPADVIGDEPIWHDGQVVGWVTSGAYAHYSGGRWRSATSRPRWPSPGRSPTASRSRSSGTAARLGC